MHPYYEDAAHLLRLLCNCGLTLREGADYRALIEKLAVFFALARTSMGSHAEFAEAVLRDLERSFVLRTPCRKSRARLVAMLGTAYGNATGSARLRA